MKSLYLILSVCLIPHLAGCAHLDPYAFDRRPSSDPRSAHYTFDFRRSEALRIRELILGMDMRDVRTAWGEPGEVQIAGNPAMGNQRWIYYTSPSLRWGLRQARVVYFEGGKVAGWETGSVR